MWEPLVEKILRIFPPLFTKYICFMGFMMATRHNALWDDALIHCDFNTLQSKIKIIVATYNIYCQMKNIFTNDFTIFTHVHIFSAWGKMSIDFKKVQMQALGRILPSKRGDHLMLGNPYYMILQLTRLLPLPCSKNSSNQGMKY